MNINLSINNVFNVFKCLKSIWLVLELNYEYSFDKWILTFNN